MAPLDDYIRKRNFDRTPEPRPTSFAAPGPHLRFVVQKHHASHLHYDFRIECGGVLVSFAVPKGPSLSTDEKRLAVRVEDHPLGYGDFEGKIPQGEYGGGEVILWDRGDCYPESEDGTVELNRERGDAMLAEQLKAGKVSLTLRGSKLQGSFALVKTTGGPNHWLLLKHQDEFATAYDVLRLERSVASTPASAKFVPPMLLHEADSPAFGGPDWQFEVKLDGIRCQVVRQGLQVHLFSRNGADLTSAFPEIVAAARRVPAESFVWDGELVLYDETGKPSFQRLMQIMHGPATSGANRANLEFCMFDLLELNGESLIRRPLRERLALLDEWSLAQPLRRLDSLGHDGATAFRLASEFGFEGVVGKLLSSRYNPGQRTRDWLKVKSYHSAEFVVIGFAKGSGSRESTFRSLLLAEETETGLVEVGSVGSGFSEETLQELLPHLLARTQDEPACPCTPDRGKVVTWVRPEIWIEVRFMERTDDGHLRHPVFLRTRYDRMLQAEHFTREADLGRQLASIPVEGVLQYGDFRLGVTKLTKVNWPGQPGVTKREYLAYLTRVWPFMAPHIMGRPLTLIRFPNGIDQPGVFQKHFQHEPPPFVERVAIWSDTNNSAQEFILCNNWETLVWLGQMGILEIHSWYSSVHPIPQVPGDVSSSREALDASVLNYPDYLVFDLDPPGKSVDGFRQCAEGASVLHEVLQSIGLPSFLKTSGRSGLHVFVPIMRRLNFASAKQITHFLGQHLSALRPDLFTLEWAKENRADRVYFDANQNGRGRTLPAPYSVRAVPNAPVSKPALWTELPTLHPEQNTIQTWLSCKSWTDPWSDFFDARVDIEAVLSLRQSDS